LVYQHCPAQGPCKQTDTKTGFHGSRRKKSKGTTNMAPINKSLARYPSLEGKTVLITGGAIGIGEGFVEHFFD
jgi:hypothetical protein